MRLRLSWCVGAALVAQGVAAGARLSAQSGPLHSARWTVDSASSLAWWQVDPNYGHLWATTCPDEPSWQAGEGRNSGYNYRDDPKVSQSETHSTRIPLWPRDSVQALCRAAVRGEVTVTDPTTWQGTRGMLAVLPDSLTMGSRMRDQFARKYVFSSTRHHHIEFSIDSLFMVQPGDTIRAVAAGTLRLRGIEDQVVIPVVAWREGAGLRVQGQLGMPAKRLVDHYGVSSFALGMGVGMRRWNTLHMGLDVVLRPSGGE